MAILKAILFFIIAAIFEIGGGYLIWIWLREGRSFWCGVVGAIVLVIYGFIPTLQPGNFERVYAAYGGVFVVMSLIWGWKIDQVNPDKFDIVGSMIVLLGVGIIMFWPRD